MNLQVEQLDTHEALLTINIEQAEYRKAQQAVARKLSKDYRFPGFRPGNVPMNLIIKAVGDEAFKYEVADELARTFYSKALEESKLNPYGQGKIEDIKDEPPQMVVRVSLQPEVDLRNYKEIRVEYAAPIVDEAEIQAQLEAMQNENAIVKMVERPASQGDLIEGKIVAYNANEEAVFDLEEDSFVLDDKLDSAMHLIGLSEAVLGMSADENRTVALKVDDSEEDESLRGTEVSVQIRVDRVSSRELPSLDDSLAQTVGTFDTFADLRADVEHKLLDYKLEMANRDYNDIVVNAFANEATVIYPPSYMGDRLDEAIANLKDRAKNSEKMDFADWVKLQGVADEAGLREKIKTDVESQAKVNLVLGAVSKAESVMVAPNEIMEELQNFAQYLGDQKAVNRLMRDQDFISGIYNRKLTNRVIERMGRIAKGEGEAPAESAGEVPVEAPAEDNSNG
ncbi:MAG: trigger factor [Anaerolineae bacterium]|nr:trigger factor [Anaerolineae bacterium]